jgi:hypothetical protein
MNCARTDSTRQIQYDAIPNGRAQLKFAVRRLIHGLRPQGRKNPIHLLDILAWFRGVTNKDVIHHIIHELEQENEIIQVVGTGGYRLKTVGDVIRERKEKEAKSAV